MRLTPKIRVAFSILIMSTSLWSWTGLFFWRFPRDEMTAGLGCSPRRCCVSEAMLCWRGHSYQRGCYHHNAIPRCQREAFNKLTVQKLRLTYLLSRYISLAVASLLRLPTRLLWLWLCQGSKKTWTADFLKALRKVWHDSLLITSLM